MKRGFDVILACVLLVLLAPLLVCIGVLVRVTSPGPMLYWSDRVGQGN